MLRQMIGAGVAAGALLMAGPAAAQFFMQAKDMSGQPVTGTETGLGPSLPGATPEEAKAAIIWNVRAALNVAALQCQFEPTLLAVSNYNAMLVDHKAELKRSWDELGKYFARTNKTPKAAQNPRNIISASPPMRWAATSSSRRAAASAPCRSSASANCATA